MTDQAATRYRPRTVSPPGETLADLLEERQLTQKDLARRMDRPTKTINEIIKGKTAIVSDTALQLERVLGTPAEFWLQREARYREYIARCEDEQRLKEQAPWLSELPTGDMVKFGWIKKQPSKSQTVAECFKFFAVASVPAWRQRYGQEAAAFRTSKKVPSSPGAVAAWLRQGELEAERMNCRPFNGRTLKAALQELRELTLDPSPASFVPKLQAACSRHGVAVVFVPAPKRCPASGATRWLTADKAVVQLSLRYKSNDHLWFTFFHEMGHIILHGKRLVFIEGDGAGTPEHEDQADRFARDILIPQVAARHLGSIAGSKAAAVKLAKDVGVAPGIVVGRLQKEGLIDWSHMNDLKLRYDWNDSSFEAK
jgi:addiction module HigA family antidote